jgi:hypothetical protein
MVHTTYFDNYQGPKLIKATLNQKDILDEICEYYGPNNNWQNKYYSYKDLFGENSRGKKIYLEFETSHGRHYWFHSFINDPSQLFIPSKIETN